MSTAVVTGAGRGIGRAIAMKLASMSYDLFVIARSKNELEELKHEIKAFYSKVGVTIVVADLSDIHSTVKAANVISSATRQVNVLVNNVGAYKEDTIYTARPEDLRAALNTNFFSAFNLWSELHHLIQEGGTIVNICSVLSNEIRKEAFSYTLSKASLYTFGKFLQTSCREKGIRVTNILPGSVNTPSWDGLNAPVKEFVQPEDIASAIESLISSKGWVKELVIRPLKSGY